MRYDFDRIIERRGTDSDKWGKYGDDVIPLWVADMDFVSPEPVVRALHHRVDHAVFGYTQPAGELRTAIRERLKKLYHWDVKEEEVLFLPGLVTGLNVAFHVFAGPGEGVLAQPPVYHHLLRDPVLHHRALNRSPLVRKGNSYEIDFDIFGHAITNQTRIFLLCNPHNPVGRAYTKKELGKMAEICLRYKVIVCSDEIHCDLIFPGYCHVPIAALGPEVADRTVTLMAPSKTFNLAGLRCGFAIIQNPELRRMWKTGSHGIVPGANIMGHVAALAAYTDGQEWLDQVLIYLEGSKDFLAEYVRERLSPIRMMRIEATYLAWLDCREARIPGNPFDFFLREAKVALNDGAEFGKEGKGFVRLNFACPRVRLKEALDRMALALKKI